MSTSGYDDPPRPIATVYAVELEGESVLYDTAENQAMHLDARATLIWQVLDGSVTVDELVEDLSAVFGVDKETIWADVDRMLTQLHELGFLEPAAASRTTSSVVLADPPSP